MKILALFFATVVQVAAQSPQVPHKMQFADITLTIRDDARREIQKDVDAMTQSPKHYNIKAERARMYFPLIEKAFAEEGIPDDFKYLALQESSLIPDAVSTSNAVGFWQFKDFTAIEMGLRVDSEVDERLNIVSSSRAAARYIKKNNAQFDNWIYALQAYQMGAGGVARSVSDTQGGAKRMEITSKTYWYVKKFLAHKIAFEPGVNGKAQTSVIVYDNNTGKSLRQIAKDVSVSEEELLAYNKWTKSGWVPNDRTYAVVIPVSSDRSIASDPYQALAAYKPDVKNESASVLPATVAVKKKVNGVQTIQAVTGETPALVAARSKVSLGKFLKWNDLGPADPIKAGEYYFLGKKRGRAKENFHKVTSGETLWIISQRYGVSLKRLRKFNRLNTNQELTAGTMLWLASMKPKEEMVVTATDVAQVDDTSFNWAADTNDQKVAIVAKADSIIISEPEKTIVSIPDSVLLQTESQLEVVADSSQLVSSKASTVYPSLTQADTLRNAAPGPVSSLPNTGNHTVQAKETLYSIAKMYGVGVMDLVKWNNLDLQHGLRIGQVLIVKDSMQQTGQVAQEAKVEDSFHVVKASDTLYSIARQYSVTIKEIMEWNDKKDFSISVGEKLKISR